MIVKKHITNDKRLILAVCDKNLIGKRFSEDKKQLDLSVPFYQGKDTDEAEIISLMKKAYSINAVGKNSVGCCIKAELIDKTKASNIKGIPYAQIIVS